LLCNPFFRQEEQNHHFQLYFSCTATRLRVCEVRKRERERDRVCKKSAALIENEPFLRKANRPFFTIPRQR
jgi:hypothetical protein